MEIICMQLGSYHIAMDNVWVPPLAESWQRIQIVWVSSLHYDWEWHWLRQSFHSHLINNFTIPFNAGSTGSNIINLSTVAKGFLSWWKLCWLHDNVYLGDESPHQPFVYDRQMVFILWLVYIFLCKWFIYYSFCPAI